MSKSSREGKAQELLNEAHRIKKRVSEFGPAYEVLKLQIFRRDLLNGIVEILNILDYKASELRIHFREYEEIALVVPPRISVFDTFDVTAISKKFDENFEEILRMGNIHIPYEKFVNMMKAFSYSLMKGDLDAQLYMDPEKVLHSWILRNL